MPVRANVVRTNVARTNAVRTNAVRTNVLAPLRALLEADYFQVFQ